MGWDGMVWYKTVPGVELILIVPREEIAKAMIL